MRRHGKTTAGKQRWLCLICTSARIHTRYDTRIRHLLTYFIHWLTGVIELAGIARARGVSRKHLSTLFLPLWDLPAPQPSPLPVSLPLLIVDGVYLSGRVNAALVGHTGNAVVTWDFCERECYVAWRSFLSRFTHIHTIVMDGQKGLSEAVHEMFPHTKIQRCVVHVERYVRIRLSRNPTTEAGRLLWHLMRSIWDVHTIEDVKVWKDRFQTWNHTNESFLRERSYAIDGTHWWYTHRMIRSARSHLIRALPYLFTYTTDPTIPRTTNHVEGGVNSRLKELVRRHRGFSPKRKRVMAAYYFEARKNTQKVT